MRFFKILLALRPKEDQPSGLLTFVLCNPHRRHSQPMFSKQDRKLNRKMSSSFWFISLTFFGFMCVCFLPVVRTTEKLFKSPLGSIVNKSCKLKLVPMCIIERNTHCCRRPSLAGLSVYGWPKREPPPSA